MLNRAKNLILGCALVFTFAQSLAAQGVIVLRGSNTKIAVDEGIKKITVTNPRIIDARPASDGRSVTVSGLAEGVSDLVIELVKGPDLVKQVTVKPDLGGMLEQVKELLSDVEGLELKTVGSKIVVKGNIVTKSGYDRAMKVIEAYSGVILNLTTFDQTHMSKYVEEAILRDIGLDTVSVSVKRDTAVLEGYVFSKGDFLRAEEMAKLRMPNVLNLLGLQEVMIETDVQFVSVSLNSNKSMGSNLLKGLNIGGSGGISGGAVSYGVTGSSATAKINALVGEGSGTVLMQPHLSTKSGEEGTFHNGGETFFSVAGNVGGSLEKVQFGVLLKVQPTMQGRDSILNKITIEVSMPAAKSEGAISLDKFETTSTALCKVGESIVLSGLVQQLSSKFNEKTPGLGSVPLLKFFFSEKGSKNDKKELLVIVTPRPVFPKATPGQAFGEERRKSLEDALNQK